MTTDIHKHIVKSIKALRIEQHLTQAQLATKAGMYPNAYAKIERGERKPEIETLEKLVKALGVKFSDILPS